MNEVKDILVSSLGPSVTLETKLWDNGDETNSHYVTHRLCLQGDNYFEIGVDFHSGQNFLPQKLRKLANEMESWLVQHKANELLG